MRDTIDFGIDLGTTNSAIAVVDGGTLQVVKNHDQMDFTPSAIYLRTSSAVQVGAGALEYVYRDPDNAASEFKLEMGQANAGRDFVRAGVRLSPPQMSAEVLKSLRASAATKYGEPPEAAVITVPAAFALNQTNATNEAARLAGFTIDCPLLQEPTAAAFAYGLEDESDRATWMVFDLGGGTFDAAIVRKRDGEFQVINHSGDPYLGGKLIDWAIVDRVLAPAVASRFGLPDFHRDNPKWRMLFALLKGRAENAKVQLSTTDTAWIEVELPVAGGREDFEYTLTRQELEKVAEPFYAQAIRLCRDALTEGGLGAADVDRLLLVGSPTMAPGLRKLLADPTEGLGITLDHSQDPSTVVARGAALFASRLRLQRPMVAPKADEFTVELAYEPVVTAARTIVGGRLHSSSTVDWTRFTVVLRGSGTTSFDSGRLLLNAEGGFMTEVVVTPKETTRFVEPSS
ncbi:Hsp70 family protein [Fodinicola feengrottensis]|uniref:Hsp70 family protein n=1 Tax=Fodinicola feengrottensis TaxID=435914 RepID=UPI0024427694|nr:Hsp70 family protein [Fodinicola feengrottensis]